MRLVVATNQYNSPDGYGSGIGVDGEGIPWPYCKADMKMFYKLTKGMKLMVGRKTYEEVGELKGREMIVVGKGYNTFEEALEKKPDAVIGGSQIYESCLRAGVVTEIYESKIIDHSVCNRFFGIPRDVLEGWEIWTKSKGKKKGSIQKPAFYKINFLSCEEDPIISEDLNSTFII